VLFHWTTQNDDQRSFREGFMGTNIITLNLNFNNPQLKSFFFFFFEKIRNKLANVSLGCALISVSIPTVRTYLSFASVVRTKKMLFLFWAKTNFSVSGWPLRNSRAICAQIVQESLSKSFRTFREFYFAAVGPLM